MNQSYIPKYCIKKGGKSATVLQQAQVSVLDNSVCKKEYKKIRKLVTPNQFDYAIICAGHLAGGIDACKGDSGKKSLHVHKNGLSLNELVPDSNLLI